MWLDRGWLCSLRAHAPSPQRRDYEAFAEWLAARAQGGLQDESYWLSPENVESSAPQRVVQSCTLMQPLPGLNDRWFEFDQQQVVQWRLNPSGSFSSAGAFQAAVNIWNNDKSTNIQYAYVGETAAQDFTRRFTSRGEGLVLNEDPFDIAPGRCGGADRV